VNDKGPLIFALLTLGFIMYGSRKGRPPPKPVARVVTVPGGSNWRCAKCGTRLEPGSKALKIGSETYCIACATSSYEKYGNTLLKWEGGNPSPLEEKYRLVKRTKRGSLVVIEREGDKAKLEIPNLKDSRDISNLLSTAGIKFDSSGGISKNAWEGAPVGLRTERGVMAKKSGTYPGLTLTFDFADLEKVMQGRFLKLEEK